MRQILVLGAFGLALLCTDSVRGQEREVLRQTFPNFFETNLGVEIETDAEGEIRVIRGGGHRVEVAGRAPGGIASFGLDAAGRRTLTLTAIGTDRVSFVLVVPEDVRVHVRLPGHQRTELVGSMRRSASYSWDGRTERAPARSLPASAAPSGAAVLESGPPPAVLSIAASDRLRRLTVRAAPAGVFRVIGDAATAITRSGDYLVLDAVQDSDLVISVPLDVLDFQLQLDGRPAVRVRAGGLSNFCEPVVSQELPDGARWLTFTPADGLACGASPPEPAARRS